MGGSAKGAHPKVRYVARPWNWQYWNTVCSRKTMELCAHRGDAAGRVRGGANGTEFRRHSQRQRRCRMKHDASCMRGR